MSTNLSAFTAACRRFAESSRFQTAILVAILLNALVIGLETSDSINDRHGDALKTLNDAFLALFTVEMAIRIAAYGRRPLNFFKGGWNVFDFVVVGAAYLPWVREASRSYGWRASCGSRGSCRCCPACGS